MRRIVSSLVVVAVSLFGLMTWPVAAQEITVRVDPPVIVRGGGFVVTVNELTPNERYTFEFIFVPTDQIVFTTDRVADSFGNISLSIRSDDTDELGAYRIDIRLNRVKVAEATFELIGEGEPPRTTPPTQPPAQTTPTPSGAVTLTVRPSEGRVRQDFQIVARGLAPRASHFVTVREAATNAIVYDRERPSDANGELRVTLFTTADNPPGEYIVQISDAFGNVLASTSFQLLGVGGRDAVLTITRRPVEPPTFEITITNAAQFSDITITVFDPDTRTSIFQRIVRTNVDGFARTEFTLPADLALKPFTVVLTDIEGEVTRGVIPTGPAPSPFDLSIAARPESGRAGQVFNVSANGLPLAGVATFRVLSNGEPIATYTSRINRLGSATVTIPSDNITPGVYTVEVEVEGEVLIETAFEVLPVALPPSILIEPTSGPRGTTHIVVVENLPPNEVVTFEVLFGGLPVLTTSRRADSEGRVTLALTSEPRDEIGEYVVRATFGGTEVSVAYNVLADEEVPPSVVSEDGRITITPPSGPEGTSHLVEVSELPPNVPLTVRVLFRDEIVFSAERTSDADGKFSIRLITEPTDPAGVYTVEIVIDDQVIASAPLILVRAVAVPVPLGPENALPLPPNPREVIVRQGELTTAAPSTTFNFSAEAGDLVVISLRSDEFDTYLILRDPDGAEVALNDDFDGLNSRIVARLSLSGTYAVEANSYGNYFARQPETGRFTLTIERVTPHPITPDTPVQVDFSTEQDYYLTMEMPTERRYTLRGFGGDTDTSLEILGPSSQQLFFDDDGGFGLDPEILNFRTVEPGEHLIIFRRVEADGGGVAVLEVVETPFPTLEAGTAVVVLDSKLQTDGVTFEGVGGTVQTVRLEFVSGSASNVYVEAIQNGQTLTSFSSNFAVVPTLTLPIAVPEDGLVTVFVSTFSGTSTYRITLE